MRIWMAGLLALVVSGCAPAIAPSSDATSPQASPPKRLVLDEDVAQGLKEYLAGIGATGHGFFAVSKDGLDYAYFYCPALACIEQRSSYKTKALDNCRSNSDGYDCIVLAQDQDVLLQYVTHPIPLPPLDPAETPPIVDVKTPPPPPPSDKLWSETRPGWIVDSLHGCWVWNRIPGKDDVVTWTGGCAADGTASGLGVLEWKDSERYIGIMQAGWKEGEGKIVNSWGDVYQGELSHGVRNGKGAYFWADGATYEGGYKNGYPNGQGTFIERGQVYSGEWNNGCFDDGKRQKRITDNDEAACELKK